MPKLKSWKELPNGCMALEPGSSRLNKTGSWRTYKPILDKDKCIKCGICFIFCPDVAISPDFEINYDYCKGCGICAHECPVKAITMIEEAEV
jgi:pyruvate ferredoxin oxidoreductase delta subunit